MNIISINSTRHKLAVFVPATLKEWEKSAPTMWTEKEVVVKGQWQWFEPCVWGNQVGNRVYFMYDYVQSWVFVVGPIILRHT